MKYRIRFIADASLLESSLENLPARDYLGEGKVSPNTTFFDESMNCIWFEAVLDFVPQVGLSIYCDAEGYNWNEETLLMVSAMKFYMKQNFFVATLNWYLFNQLEIVREVEQKMTQRMTRRMR